MRAKRTIVITGAGSGIGRCMAQQLAALGHRILAVCRTAESATATHKLLLQTTAHADVAVLWADLSQQSEVCRLAADILALTATVDVLINNAGCVSSSRIMTKDGIELQLAVNHVAPFLLTQLVLPALKQSEQGRVVNVSSRAHARGTVQWNDLMLERGYTLSKAYDRSKLCNLMATYAWAERLKDTAITVNAFHPGLVNTSIGEKHTDTLTAWLWKCIKVLGNAPASSAKIGVGLALDAQWSTTTAQFFGANGPIPSSPESRERESIERIWDTTLHLITAN